MWKKYFIFTLAPGRVVTRQFGEIDFRKEEIDIAKLQQLFEEDFPYLKITDLGRQELYGIGLPAPVPEPIPEPEKKLSRRRKKD